MTTTKTVASKAFVAIVAAAMVFSLVAPAAKAATAEELQAQITALMAQIAALSGGTPVATTPAAGAYTFTRSLMMGAKGADVTALQTYLISKGFAIPAGATGFYGAQTVSAVAAWQTANGISPAAGYFGPVSQAKYMALMAAMPAPTPTPTTPTTPGTPSTTLKGEASLKDFNIDDADESDVQEGDADVELAVMTAKFQDGDASISRLDMTVFQDTASNPWDVFESFALMVDGKEVATINADNRDDYLDEDTNEIRFSGLNIVSMEDDETEITLVGSIQNNLDSADLGTWDVDATALRYFDADGVATTEISAPVTDDTANFDIKVAGDGEELKFALGSNNPAAQDIVVKDTSATNGITILEYTIEAIDADIELNTLKVNVQTVSAVYSSVVSDIEMDIDGKTFRDDSALSSGTASTNATIGFDINREIKIDAGDKVTVKVKVDFKRQDVNYANGTTIKAQVSTTEVDATDAEGADTITATDLTGSAIGKLHTLVASGIVVPSANFDASFDTQGTNDTIGVFTITFDVKAVDGDFYIAKAATLGTSATTGVEYTVTGPVGYLLGSSTVSAVVSSTEADEDTAGVYTVADGESNTFTLKVTIDPNVAGSYTVTLGGVNYTANANGVTATTLYSPVPSQDFRSGDEVINQ